MLDLFIVASHYHQLRMKSSFFIIIAIITKMEFFPKLNCALLYYLRALDSKLIIILRLSFFLIKKIWNFLQLILHYFISSLIKLIHFVNKSFFKIIFYQKNLLNLIFVSTKYPKNCYFCFFFYEIYNLKNLTVSTIGY